MKKFLAALILSATVLATTAFADDAFVRAGNTSLEAGVGYGWGIGGFGGLEVGILDLKLAPKFTFNVGGKAVGSVYLGALSTLSIGGAGYVTVHYSIRQLALGIDFLNNLDYWFGAGVGVALIPGFGVGGAYTSGLTYYLNNQMGITLGYIESVGSFVGVKLAFN